MTQKSPAEQIPQDAEKIVDRVRERYGAIAESSGSCCDCNCSTDPDATLQMGYNAEDIAALPDEANMSLGCGAPIDHLQLQPGETVLDLGSGGGIDAFLAASRVGPGGKVIGVDMTPEMLQRARESAQRAGLSQVEFRQGRLEELPVEDATVDAVTSNCVINLVPDKSIVFREAARVLRPGGRLVISDIVLDGPLPEVVERDLLAYVGCVAGAMQRDDYFESIRAAGLSDIEVLKDVDYLASIESALPEEAVALMQRTGVRPEELRGKVHSITFRARKP